MVLVEFARTSTDHLRLRSHCQPQSRLAAEPLRTWLRPLGEEPVIGWLFRYDATFYVISYLGILLNGVVAPLLLFRRPRTLALIVLGAFHVSNELIFRIGAFLSALGPPFKSA